MTRQGMEQKFATQLAMSSRRWRLVGDQALAGLGVSNASGWCLVFIQRLGEDACQSDLARAVEVREPTLVRMLNSLEASGLVERSAHPHDARAKITRLTAEGLAIVGEVEGSLRQLRKDLLADVSDDDLAAALRVLDSVSVALSDRQDC